MSDDSPQLRTDLALRLTHHSLRPVYRVDTVERRVMLEDGSRRRTEDFARIHGRDNLGQAIVLRLLTMRGELTALAHPDYGSRLHELVGRPDTATTRNLVRLYVLEALQQEARIEKIVAVEVTSAPGTRDTLRVDIRVRPVGTRAAMTIAPLLIPLN